MNKKIKKIILGGLCSAAIFMTAVPTNVFAASASGSVGGKSVSASLTKGSQSADATTKVGSGQAALEAKVTLISKRGSQMITTGGRASNYSTGVIATAKTERNTDIVMRAESYHYAYNNNTSWTRNLNS